MHTVTIVTQTPVTRQMIIDYVLGHPRGRFDPGMDYGYIEFDDARVMINPDPGLWPYDAEDLETIARALGGPPRASIDIDVLRSRSGSDYLASEVAIALISQWGGARIDDIF